MAYFPFFTDVTNLKGIIIGGGYVATEKVERLVEFDADLTVIAPEICDEIKAYSNNKNLDAEKSNAEKSEAENSNVKNHILPSRIKLIEREYQKSDLEGADYVIAATNIGSVNQVIYNDAKEKHLLINVVDDPDKCDFIFPSVAKKGKLVVGVSSSGAGPQVSIRLRKQIEEMLPRNIEEILDFLAEERIRVKNEISDSKERRRYLIELSDKLLNSGFDKQN